MATSIKVADIFASFGFKLDQASVSRVDSLINGTRSSTRRLRTEVNSTTESVRNLTSQFGYARDAAALMMGAFTLNTIKNAIYEGDKFSKTISVISKDAQHEAELLGYLNGEVDRLGLSLQNTAKDFAGFYAAGSSTFNDAQLKEIFTSVTQAGTALSLSDDDVHASLRAIVQMTSKGKVSAEELTSQLAERLPGSLKLAARAMSMTEIELFKMMETGKLLSKDFLPKFAVELRKTFSDSKVASAMDGLQANTNRVATAWFRLWDRFSKQGGGTILNDALKGIAKGIGALVPMMDYFALALMGITSPIRAAYRLLNELLEVINKTPIGTAAMAVGLGLMATKIGVVRKALMFLLTPFGLFLLASGLMVTIVEDLWVAMNGGNSILGDLAKNGDIWAKWLIETGKLAKAATILFGELLGTFFGFLFRPNEQLLFDSLLASWKRFTSGFDFGLWKALKEGASWLGGRLPSSLPSFPSGGGTGLGGATYGDIDQSVLIRIEVPEGMHPKEVADQVSEQLANARKPLIE